MAKTIILTHGKKIELVRKTGFGKDKITRACSGDDSTDDYKQIREEAIAIGCFYKR